MLLRSAGLDASAREVRDRLGLDWRAAPFSRCPIDNAELRDAGPEALDGVPPHARGLPGLLRRCPACGRLYWPGSHVRRMQARLDAWAGHTEISPPFTAR